MKSIVVKVFRDRITGTVHQIGQEIELTKKRYEEITSAACGPFVEEIIDEIVDEIPEEIVDEIIEGAPVKKQKPAKVGA